MAKLTFGSTIVSGNAEAVAEDPLRAEQSRLEGTFKKSRYITFLYNLESWRIIVRITIAET